MRLLLLLLMFAPLTSLSQCDTNDVVKFPDVEAQFPGGTVELKKFIQENMEHPPIKQYDCFPDTRPLYFQFIVCENGEIQNIHLMRPSNSEHEEICLNLIKKMPNWIPAEINDKPVSSVVRFPIRIELF